MKVSLSDWDQLLVALVCRAWMLCEADTIVSSQGDCLGKMGHMSFQRT